MTYFISSADGSMINIAQLLQENQYTLPTQQISIEEDSYHLLHQLAQQRHQSISQILLEALRMYQHMHAL